MDSIDKWLKSLRLHKYTHLFKSLTYHEMLSLDENYLIDHNVTKGARNKMLVSVKKLNLRQDRLINMIDDIDQENISLKEALTVLKDMLVTPIPAPIDNPHAQTQPLSRARRLSISSESSSSMSLQHYHIDPYELTHLYIETLDKLAARLIESAGVEDNACHGIMAAILDECIKHNSFTKEQKAKVASYKQHFFKEQRAKVASYKQHFIREQKVKVGSYEQQLRQRPHSYNHNHYLQQHQNQQQYQLQLQQQPLPQQQQQQQHHNVHYQQHQQLLLLDQQQHQQHPQQQHPSSIHFNQPQLLQQQHQPLYHQYDHSNDNLDYSSTINKQQQQQQIYNQLPLKLQQQQYQHQTYREYSLLRPAITFELPCLRALVEKNSQV